MQHEILGEIERTKGDSSRGSAIVRYQSRDVKVNIDGDDQPFETALQLAVEVVQRLPELDKIAKRIAVARLRDSYNNGWNEYDEPQEDGSLKSVINPQLSESEFEAKLSLDGIGVSGKSGVDFFYDDEGMFWGHCIVISSFAGVNFGEADAQLFG